MRLTLRPDTQSARPEPIGARFAGGGQRGGAGPLRYGLAAVFQ